VTRGNGIHPRTREAEINAQICAAARERRLDLGVLQAQLAAHLGMAESTFSRYESGQRTMSAALLCMIAAYLRQPLTAFLPHDLAIPVGLEIQGNLSSPVRQVADVLEAHPELLPPVIGLIETLLEELQAPAELGE
jgi:transcriptional regulator with XRE-family HTH domain